MNENLTRVVIVLDRSGSMTSMQDATIAGFNEFVHQQRQIDGEADVLLVEFDDQYEVVFDLPITEVPTLDRETFIPRGSTALYDALGRTISMLDRQLASLAEEKHPAKIVVLTLTDGQENASKAYNRKQVAEMILARREQLEWEFLFLGANQGAVEVGATLNIPMRTSVTYTATAAAMAAVLKSASRHVARFRQGLPLAFSEADREEALAERKAISA